MPLLNQLSEEHNITITETQLQEVQEVLTSLGADSEDLDNIQPLAQMVEDDDFDTDFTIDLNGVNCRFIDVNEIDSIQVQELESDTYILGCFNASFIQSVTNWTSALIEACQSSEAFEALGEAIVQEGYTEAMQEEYSSLDGYGHHFNHYSHGEEEVIIDGRDFYVFVQGAL